VTDNQCDPGQYRGGINTSDAELDSAKRQATLAAKLALLGYSLHPLSRGGFLVSRWDRSRHLDDLGAVAAFLRQVGGEP
jgi:hypothetical protein